MTQFPAGSVRLETVVCVRSEWRLINATHNLLRLHNHRIAAQTA
jgi:hypothetical protein